MLKNSFKYFLLLTCFFSQTISAQETENATNAITCARLFAGFIKAAEADTEKFQPPYFSEKIDNDLKDLLKNSFDAEGHPITDSTNIAEIATQMAQIYSNIQIEKPAATTACEEYIKATTGKCLQLPDARKCLADVSSQPETLEAQKRFSEKLSLAVQQKSDAAKTVDVDETNMTIQDKIRRFIAANFIVVTVSEFVFALLVLAFLIRRLTRKPAKTCPNCQASLSGANVPTDSYEAPIGSCTCPNCGAKWTYDIKRRK